MQARRGYRRRWALEGFARILVRMGADNHPLLGPLLASCPELEVEVVRDFVTRMDPEYFAQSDPDRIAGDLRLAGRLRPDSPCQVSIESRAGGVFEIIIAAYDYFGEFAGICGLLSGFRLDIMEGVCYTMSEPVAPRRQERTDRPPRSGRPGLSRKKIIDRFDVRTLSGEPLAPGDQASLVRELERMVALLDANRLPDARRLVSRRLVETFGATRVPFVQMLHPIRIRFDNTVSPSDTIMDLRSTDTPAFLYTFANALALRGIYIHKARFCQVAGELRDRFWIRGRDGLKIGDPQAQQDLQLTAALIKQFTHFLASAPDPAKAIEHFDGFLDRLLEEQASVGKEQAFATLESGKSMTLLARLLGASDFLWEELLRRNPAELLPLLESYPQVPLSRDRGAMAAELKDEVAAAATGEERALALNRFKDRELFRIDMIHLVDPATSLPEFSRALTELGEIVLTQALSDSEATLEAAHGSPRLTDGSPCPFAVLGLGKFGGGELGYASDIELLFVYGGEGRSCGHDPLENYEYFERLVQAILRRISAPEEGTFHLDLRLRPHGGSGLLATSLDGLRQYYSQTGLAQPFERQALIKLRAVCGDRDLGRQVEDHRDQFTYSDQPWDLKTALDLRAEQIRQLVEPGRINVKYSHGGLIDIEYAVQYLQLMQGHQEPKLRATNTLQALSALEEVAVLNSEEAASIRTSYLFLRKLIDGLRIVRGHAKDLLLPDRDSEEFVYLARRLGYQAERWEEAAHRLAAEVARHMRSTHEFFTRQFGPSGE